MPKINVNMKREVCGKTSVSCRKLPFFRSNTAREKGHVSQSTGACCARGENRRSYRKEDHQNRVRAEVGRRSWGERQCTAARIGGCEGGWERWREICRVKLRGRDSELHLKTMRETQTIDATQDAHTSPHTTGDFARFDRMIRGLVVDDDTDVGETGKGRLTEATKYSIKLSGLLRLYPGGRVHGYCIGKGP